jgi:hypothetical protein
LLRSYVCSKLKQLIDMPPIAIVEDYLAFHSSMTILEESTDLDKEILRIPCSAEPYRFGKKKDYPVASTIYFNKETNRWSLENTG